jgi:hypothetical protein
VLVEKKKKILTFLALEKRAVTAFFFAPFGSNMPNATKGRDQAMNSTETNPFVAVEFDIYYKNPWDPPHEHAGIDINSMISVANVTWLADIKEGKLNEASVSYNASSLNLSVVFTGFDNVTSTTVSQHLSSIVDLRLYLPEFVTIGFSIRGILAQIWKQNKITTKQTHKTRLQVLHPSTQLPLKRKRPRQD